MVRWLLVGSLLVGLGVGFRNGWVEVNWEKLSQDTDLPFLTDPEPFRSEPERNGARQAR
jgi:hypothetical protein